MATEIDVGTTVRDLTYIETAVEDLTYIEPIEPVAKGRSRAKNVEDVAYGESVYWLTLLSAIIVITGSVIAFVTKSNLASPSYWITSVWQGQSIEQIWSGAANSVPQGHWYLSNLMAGDGLQTFGLSIAFSSISIGLAVAAIFLFKRKNIVFGVFAIIALAINTASIFS
ncbi:hypothetical protein ACFLUJ_05790 [Chloroflexota bacterium]